MNPIHTSLHGVLLPITTPFEPNDQHLDCSSLRDNLKQWLGSDVSGFVTLGSTGERVHLNENETLQLIDTARAEVPPGITFIVGAGQQSTVNTVSEIKRFVSVGADAVLVITPSFYRSAITQQTLINYYTAVADSSTVPVLLYSMPALTGIKIEPETITRLSEHPNIIGVKDSSNDMTGFAETVKLCPPDFAVMTGNGTVLLDALKLGATGAILAVGCAVPRVCLEISKSFRSGDVGRAETLQAKLTPLAAAVTTRFGIGGLKAAMDLAGYQGGTVREPLQMPNEDQRVEISKLVSEVMSASKSGGERPFPT